VKESDAAGRVTDVGSDLLSAAREAAHSH
jgi:hypothetical protein